MSHKMPVIFVVDDDAAFNKLISSHIKMQGKYEIFSYLSGEECLEKIGKNPDVILMDYELPFRDGIETMSVIKKKSPETVFIFLSGQTNVKVAVEAFKEGAFDYIVKDTHAKENALNKINQALKIKSLEKEKYHSRLKFWLLGLLAVAAIALVYFFCRCN